MNDPLKLLGFVIFGIYVVSSFWLLLNAVMQLHLLWLYKKKKTSVAALPLPDELPFVSIQVPVYNEKYVINHLLDCLAALDYPKDKFEIQVLDDSTDETSPIIDRHITLLRSSNIPFTVVRRGNRKGYKAGALQYGLGKCRGSLVAIFDADFRPDPGFLKKLVPHFINPLVGMVQARWGHLNREENALTRIQTYLLDTHFSIEQSGRAGAGYFINFCGTAGIWRRQCIEDAGGWDGSVLSEDLDISYRAQLKGWRLVYDQQTVVRAELPAAMEAFRIQQFRWTKGMAQISKKNMKQLVTSAIPADKKLHGIFHLLSSFVFVCLLVNALLTVPLLLFRNLYPEFITLTDYTLISSVNLLALTLFYYNGTRSAGNVAFFRHYPLFIIVYMALSVQNTVAVLQGFLGKGSEFVRTPKSNQQKGATSYLKGNFSWINRFEVLLFLYFLSGIGLSIYLGDYFMMLFFVMMGSGLGFIIYQTLPQKTAAVPLPQKEGKVRLLDIQTTTVGRRQSQNVL